MKIELIRPISAERVDIEGEDYALMRMDIPAEVMKIQVAKFGPVGTEGAIPALWYRAVEGGFETIRDGTIYDLEDAYQTARKEKLQ